MIVYKNWILLNGTVCVCKLMRRFISVLTFIFMFVLSVDLLSFTAFETWYQANIRKRSTPTGWEMEACPKYSDSDVQRSKDERGRKPTTPQHMTYLVDALQIYVRLRYWCDTATIVPRVSSLTHLLVLSYPLRSTV